MTRDSNHMETFDENEPALQLVWSDLLYPDQATHDAAAQKARDQLDAILQHDAASANMPRMSSEELADNEDVMPDSQGHVSTPNDNVPSSATADHQTSDDIQPDSDETIGHSSIDSAESMDAAPAMNKRPGRPAKRKRGRPAKTTPVIIESSPPVETSMSSPTPAPKPEGAAPIATKRRTRASTGDLPVAVAKAEAEPASAAKRGRGRPKKTAPVPARKGRAVKKPVARKTYKVVTPEKPDQDEDEEADDDDSDEQEWEVEKIIDDIIDDKGVHHFQVKWKGFPASDNTWEPKLHLTNCKEQMKAYLDKKVHK